MLKKKSEIIKESVREVYHETRSDSIISDRVGYYIVFDKNDYKTCLENIGPKMKKWEEEICQQTGDKFPITKVQYKEKLEIETLWDIHNSFWDNPPRYKKNPVIQGPGEEYMPSILEQEFSFKELFLHYLGVVFNSIDLSVLERLSGGSDECLFFRTFLSALSSVFHSRKLISMYCKYMYFYPLYFYVLEMKDIICKKK